MSVITLNLSPHAAHLLLLAVRSRQRTVGRYVIDPQTGRAALTEEMATLADLEAEVREQLSHPKPVVEKVAGPEHTGSGW